VGYIQFHISALTWILVIPLLQFEVMFRMIDYSHDDVTPPKFNRIMVMRNAGYESRRAGL
jgi:hypothetical protein